MLRRPRARCRRGLRPKSLHEERGNLPAMGTPLPRATRLLHRPRESYRSSGSRLRRQPLIRRPIRRQCSLQLRRSQRGSSRIPPFRSGSPRKICLGPLRHPWQTSRFSALQCQRRARRLPSRARELQRPTRKALRLLDGPMRLHLRMPSQASMVPAHPETVLAEGCHSETTLRLAG